MKLIISKLLKGILYIMFSPVILIAKAIERHDVKKDIEEESLPYYDDIME